MSDLILPSVELPDRNPPNLKDLKISRLEERCLNGWGLKEPYRGITAEVTADQETFYWLGEFTVRDEAPLMLVTVPHGGDIHVAPWFYGVLAKSDIETAPEPVEALFDAAIYGSARSGLATGYKLPITVLNEIIPAGYADPER